MKIPRREETVEEFHLRIIRRCEAMIARLELEAATALTVFVRERRLTQAAAERRNVELHLQRLTDLATQPGSDGGPEFSQGFDVGP
ncbi:MAG: hypothetical protein NVS3B5_20290 [Sphingomicrobium sp.]